MSGGRSFLAQLTQALGLTASASQADIVHAVADLARERASLRERLGGAWMSVPMRWRKVPVGAIVLGGGARPWTVRSRRPEGLDLVVTVREVDGDRDVLRTVGPDDTVHVLLPVVERDALLVLRRELAGELVEPEAWADVEGEYLRPWAIGDMHACPVFLGEHMAAASCAAYARRFGDRAFLDEPVGEEGAVG